MAWGAGLFAACLLLAGCAAPPPAKQPFEAAGDPGRQVLLMLREAPIHHYQGGGVETAGYGSAAPASVAALAQELGQKFHLKLVSDWPMPSIGVRCYVAEIPPATSPAEVAAGLAADARVESAQPVQKFHLLTGAPGLSEEPAAGSAPFARLHRIATGRSIRVAEVDTGVELSHPDLRAQLVEPVNFVDQSDYGAELHGTAVAGIIVARAHGGIAGVAPDATLMPLRACWQEAAPQSGASCTSFTLAKAIQFAIIHQAQVLNLSLAGPPDRLLERLIEKAAAQGVTIVAAVDPARPADSFPARLPEVVAVTSSGSADPPPRVVAAPGERVLTTTLHASWGFVTGNSFAAAQVSGVAALLLEIAPGMRPADVTSLLLLYSHRDAAHGAAGTLDACGLLVHLAQKAGCPCCDPASPAAASSSPAGPDNA